MTTIAEALRRFQAAEQARAPEAVEATDLVLQNLVSFLEGYGYQYVGDDEEELEAIDQAIEEAIEEGLVIESADDIIDITPYLEQYDEDESETDFIEVHSPDMIPASIDGFLYDWQIRKFMGNEDDARDAAQVVERLVDWLANEGLADAEEARIAATTARTAADELPRAIRLSDILYDLAEETSASAADDPDAEVVDDFLAIERVEPGRLWFEEGVGPIEVPEEASRMASVGWWVNLVAAKLSGHWRITEVGNVYPRVEADDEDDDDLDLDGGDLDDPA